MKTRELALLMNPDGTPAQIHLAARPSESAPGRVKATFTAELEEGTTMLMPDGSSKAVNESGTVALCPEFRIEIAA